MRDLCSPFAPGFDGRAADRLAATLKVIADPSRIQLLNRLLAEHPYGLRVYELRDAVTVGQPTVSHHLHVLARSGVVEREEHQRGVTYYACPDALAHVADLLHIPADSPQGAAS